jgi:hypothetical protein
MSDGKSELSEAQTYQAIGAFWDTHDLSDYWEQTQPVAFEVDAQLQTTYYPVENALSAKLRATAAQRGVSAETLLNLWLQEKITQEAVAK